MWEKIGLRREFVPEDNDSLYTALIQAGFTHKGCETVPKCMYMKKILMLFKLSFLIVRQTFAKLLKAERVKKGDKLTWWKMVRHDLKCIYKISRVLQSDMQIPYPYTPKANYKLQTYIQDHIIVSKRNANLWDLDMLQRCFR